MVCIDNEHKSIKVLLIEDSEDDAFMILCNLRKHGFEPQAERVDGRDELRQALEHSWDIIIADYNLPGFNGLEALAIVQEITPHTPFVLVSGVADETLGADLMDAGARDYVNKGNLTRLPHVIRRELFREEDGTNKNDRPPDASGTELSWFALNQFVNAWSLTSEKGYPIYIGHQRRVAQLAVAIAREMQCSYEQLQALYYAGMLHDIGRSWQGRDLWESRDSLTAHEWELIRKHPEIGYTILRTIPFPWAIADIVLQHHEHVDGTGYPQGLLGDAIMLEAKILAVADAVEALTSARRHRPAFQIPIAIATIELEAGTHYDREVVEVCQKLLEEQHFTFS